MKSSIAIAIMLAAGCAFGAMTAKTAWTQRWPWDAKVDIDFELSGGEKCDVSASATFTTNGVPVTIELERFGAKGDFWELEPGVHHIVWDPAAAGFDVAEFKDFSVTVTPVENAAAVRKWLVLSIVDGTWEYRADEPDGGWGDDYKKSKMVFRRIPAGPFTAGLSSEEAAYLDTMPGNHNNEYYINKKTMTITHDYYIAIYRTTKAQHYRLLDPKSAEAGMKPCVISSVYYPSLRGSNSVDGIDWPTTRFTVKKGSVIDKFRTRFGGHFWIDLSTGAQWEKAARGGTDTFWYNGGTVDTPYSECTNLVNAIAWSCVNPSAAPYTYVDVGTLLANQYGLCDVVGMRHEYVLDRYVSMAEASSETIDPVGPYGGTKRMLRAQPNSTTRGLRYHSIAYFTAESIDNTSSGTYQTFRYAIHLRPPQSFDGKWERD